eukprot:TRINITY_DN14309_c1_g1_i1.p1 TRINITY_DN14309_c1_g1~~TRINITY_DN14309_c1_g1_i1.p1  ORF type:complete len:108 (-),score=2.43 TRINITY_DN14309_c1_g1_i1:288-611(-)
MYLGHSLSTFTAQPCIQAMDIINIHILIRYFLHSPPNIPHLAITHSHPAQPCIQAMDIINIYILIRYFLHSPPSIPYLTIIHTHPAPIIIIMSSHASFTSCIIFRYD